MDGILFDDVTEVQEKAAPKAKKEGVVRGGHVVYKGAEAEYEASKKARRLARDLSRALEEIRTAKRGYADMRTVLLPLAVRLAAVLAEEP